MVVQELMKKKEGIFSLHYSFFSSLFADLYGPPVLTSGVLA